MKTHEIITSKGEFVVVDSTTLDKVSGQALVDEYGDYIILSEATEEDVIKVVDEHKCFVTDTLAYQDYKSESDLYRSAKLSLHSLLKSKGIDVNNGNWYLFKKI